MTPSLGGHLWVYKGIEFDYPFIEAMESILPICEEVAITLFSDNDYELFMEKYGDNKQIKHKKLDESLFLKEKDKTRLNLFTNMTRDLLSTDWQFCLQADEILHENTYPAIKEAMSKPNEAYIVRRFNLWGSPYTYLNYPKLIAAGRYGELPCSDHTGRLAKIKYNSWGDAESLDAPFNHDYMEAIRTYHVGFVRDKRKMVQAKMVMQRDVFALGYFDPRFQHDIDHNDGKFDPYTRFSKDDMLPIYETLPKTIIQWAKERA